MIYYTVNCLFVCLLTQYLGYSRKPIPGYPTYEVQVFQEKVFNLFINPVRLEDDAEFQCQVGPAGDDEPPLAETCQLTVLGDYFFL